MKTNIRIELAAKEAVDSLFFIKKNAEDTKLEKECQRAINTLFKAFPGALPQPQDENVLFAK